MTALTQYPTRTDARVLRVGAFVTISLCLAVGAHRLAGGTAPTPAVWTALLGLTVLGSRLSARERSGRTIAAVVIGTQLLIHLGFALPALVEAARAGKGGLSTAALTAALFCHHGTQPITDQQLRAATRGLNLSYLHTTTSPAPTIGAFAATAIAMLLAHLGAAALVAWWLRCGERAAWAAARRTVARLRPLVACLLAAPAAALIATRSSILASGWRAGTVRERGPPPVAA